MRGRDTQRTEIFRLLGARVGEWVPLYEILPLAAQYNTRIKELRERGHIIDNHTRHVDGVVHSWFRLVESRRQPELFSKAQEVTAAR